MAISQRELLGLSRILANEEPSLLHFKAGFVNGKHQLIMVFSHSERAVNTGRDCQEENVKELNDLMGLTQPGKQKLDADKCPDCDRDAVVGLSINIDGNKASQSYYCSECGHEGSNTFVLVSQY